MDAEGEKPTFKYVQTNHKNEFLTGQDE